MSATLDAAMFAAYFRDAAGGGGVPTLAAGGRAFPVQQVRHYNAGVVVSQQFHASLKPVAHSCI